MKGKIIVLACILIVPLAFAQRNTTQPGANESARDPEKPTEAATPAGRVMVVNSFTPGSAISVGIAPHAQPVKYVLSKSVEYVDSAGNKIDPSLIRPGARVRLETTGKEKHATVDRVILIQRE
jgi:hypothetical protein